MRGNLFTKREFSYRLEKNIPVKKWSEIARNKVQLSCLRQFKFSSKPSLSSAAHVGHLAMFQFWNRDNNTPLRKTSEFREQCLSRKSQKYKNKPDMLAPCHIHHFLLPHYASLPPSLDAWRSRLFFSSNALKSSFSAGRHSWVSLSLWLRGNSTP